MARRAKRLLALLLALMMYVSLLPATALAEDTGEEAGTIALVEEPAGDGPLDVPEGDHEDPSEDVVIADDPESLPPTDEDNAVTSGQCGDDLTWHFDTETGVLTVTGTGAMWDWTDGGTPWNSIRSSITAAELPDGLTSIGNYAFWECRSLTSITIPASVTAIGEYAFYGAGLTELTIPGSVETIGKWAFAQNRSLERVTLQEGISSIGIWAFCYCSHLREIRIPASTAALGGNALRSDPALTDVYYGGTRSQWAQIAPDYLDRYQVTVHCSDGDVETLDRAFCGDDLTWALENGVLTVSGTGDMWDFYEKVWGLGMSIGGESTAPWSTCLNEITGVVIEPGVTSVGACAFSGCRNLSSISMPDGLTRIGNGAFQGCTSLQSVTIPQGVEVLGPAAFYYCQKLSQVTLPSGLREIGGEVSGGAFQWCTSLREITIPDSVTVIGNRAFYGCSSLETVCLPTALTSIGWDGFFDCSGLHTIIFQGGAPSIRTDAFSGVTATAYYPAEDETWTDDVRQSYGGTLTWVALIASGQCGDDLTWTLSDDGVLTISGTGDMWDYDWDNNAPPWLLNYQDSIVALVVEPGVTGIGARAFAALWNLQSVELADSLETIKANAFYCCSRLTELHFPAGIRSIQSYAFSYCTALHTIYLPSGVKTIERDAFADSGKLRDVYYGGTMADWAAFSAGLESGSSDYWLKMATIHCTDGDIVPDGQYCGNNATWTLEDGVLTISGTGETWDMYPGRWYDMREQITRIVVEEGITGLNRHCFYYLDRVTSVSLPRSLTGIRQGAFMYMSSLKSLELPETLEQFGHEVFIGTGLRKMKLPATLTTLPARTFQDCRSLQRVELPEGLTAIDEGAFRWATALDLIVIPAGVSRLEDLAFDGCTGLKQVWFLGSAPEFGGAYISGTDTGTYTFRDVTATVHYPADDPSWTEEVRQSYGGDLTWVPYTGEPMINVFSDVPEGKYYYEPVLWAYYHDPQITGGISDTEFGPSKTCTREQIVTFLWKAKGAPEPVTTENPFTDVKEGKWYYKPVLWAVENGITGGMDATHFGVGKPCTREQAMTFLWKAMGSPEPTTTVNPFEDVKSTKYYYKPVLWAVENGITGGVDATHFGVGKPCTRGQIVTFLYKALAD